MKAEGARAAGAYTRGRRQEGWRAYKLGGATRRTPILQATGKPSRVPVYEFVCV